jgi:hypothetical protein
VNLWEAIAEHPELFDLELHSHEDLPHSDSDDENLASFSFKTHQLLSRVPPTTEEILNTSNHIIVDPPPVTSQKKGKS